MSMMIFMMYSNLDLFGVQMAPRRDPVAEQTFGEEEQTAETTLTFTAEQQAQILQSVQCLAEDQLFKRNKAFHGLGGQPFHRDMGARRSEKWLRDTEAVFRRMVLTDEEKTALATHQFGGTARFWWENTVDPTGEIQMPWEQFKEVFREKYISEVMQE